MCPALGKVCSSPFEKSSILRLKRAAINEMDLAGWNIVKHPDDHSGVPIDYKFQDLALRVAEDLEVGMGHFSKGPDAKVASTLFAEK